MSFIFSSAFASGAVAETAASGFDLRQLLPMALIFGLMYFVLIRPQQKKQKQHQELVNGLQKGDRIETSGGIVGTVHKVDNDREITVEIAENVRVKIIRSAVVNITSGNGSLAQSNAAAPAAKHA